MFMREIEFIGGKAFERECFDLVIAIFGVVVSPAYVIFGEMSELRLAFAGVAMMCMFLVISSPLWILGRLELGDVADGSPVLVRYKGEAVFVNYERRGKYFVMVNKDYLGNAKDLSAREKYVCYSDGKRMSFVSRVRIASAVKLMLLDAGLIEV